MKIAVIGLWHLGMVIASCLAKVGHEVMAFDPDASVIDQLKKNEINLFEPGLKNLLFDMQQSQHLHFTSDPNDLAAADIYWISFDTPVNDDDEADVDFVVQETIKLFPVMKNNSLMLISSQIPVGTTHYLQQQCEYLYPHKKLRFVYVPENLRLGKALDLFMCQDRVIIGVDDPQVKPTLEKLFHDFSSRLIFISIASAEMTKHALNAFLAVSVTFINEIASLCETVGADASEVERALKTEERIGPKAYLRPGAAIAGGTLLRDIQYLNSLAKNKQRETYLLSSLLKSNHYHKTWSCRKLNDLFGSLHQKRISLLGLTYKPGTNTLRRSLAIDIAGWLHEQGAEIQAYDPKVDTLPIEMASFIEVKSSLNEAIKSADAILVTTEWPQFRELQIEQILSHAKQPIVLDPSGFLHDLRQDEFIQYYSVGVCR